MDEKSLSHTSWNCKYHIVLVPKYRRKVIYGKLRKDIGKILRMLCDYKHVEIIEAHAMPDHIHMLLSIPPKLAVTDFMAWMAGNVVVDTDPAGNIKPTKAKSPEKIDGIVAAIMALDRCIRNEGQQQGSVYDERDMIVF